MLTKGFREIFGPILPIVPVGSVDEAYDIVRNRCVSPFHFLADVTTPLMYSPSPLVIYLFTNQQELRDKYKEFHHPPSCCEFEKKRKTVLRGVRCGSLIQNDCVQQLDGM